MTAARRVRDDLIEFVRRDLVGPVYGEEEVLEDEPKVRYGAGVLFPQETVRNESDAFAGVEGDVGREPDDDDGFPDHPESVPTAVKEGESHIEPDYDDPVGLANTYQPSAMGLSFMIQTPPSQLTIEATAATYESARVKTPDGKRETTKWTRRPLSIQPLTVELDLHGSTQDLQVAPGLMLRVLSRPRPPGQLLVTTSIYNTTIKNASTAKTYFQVGLSVKRADESPAFVEYRTLEGMPASGEDTALAMLYRRRRVFAAGHGCAADWAPTDSDRTTRVSTSVFPAVTVPSVVPVGGDHRYLDMQFLGGDCADPRSEIPAALRQLCDAYERWIVDRDDETQRLDPRFSDSAHAHLALCRTAIHRIRKGIELLSDKSSKALDAFMLVNQVMLMQQHHSRLRRKLGEPWAALPLEGRYKSDWKSRRGFWHSFQLAFILMTLPALCSAEAQVQLGGQDVSERDVVDLLWFATGGGKTEAYLGATAFAILFTRLRGENRTGCQVLMRYTLRLLTSQQFQRAASMICACELIRRRDPDTLGSEPISIGLWVGMSLTPNRHKEALRMLADLSRKREAKNPFQLLSCPWCGTELDNDEKLGYGDHRGTQIFLCPEEGTAAQPGCPFSKRGQHLPVVVVDEAIYDDPPTLIIGTVDKFAMLAWRQEAGAIFSGGIDLIIQDELHLISGPLGSMVGLYESVIDFLASRGPRRPKIIASTATIRRADAQCRALYDRPMFQFPPPGLDASDSYFAREDPEVPGRTYVGFLPTASSSPLTAQIRSVVALQQGVTIVRGSGDGDSAIDPYWTLVQYFGSLKELGRAATFLTADIPEFLPTMHRRYALESEHRRWMRTSEELTSRKNEDEIPKILKRLEVRYRNGADWDDQALDTLLATSMISVGVDVDRLGLMMVVTQPKGTSEYIQASSRVGRSDAAPGLIFTLYNAGRPRDRSHYEQFRGYHEAFYRFVEPTSVTPWAPPAMERALHAALVIAGRHAAGWREASEFDRGDKRFAEFLAFLRARVRSVDPAHVADFEIQLEERLADWERRLPRRWGDLSGEREEPLLMRIAGAPDTADDPDSWETPTSMRSVDVECSAQVVPRYLAGVPTS